MAVDTLPNDGCYVDFYSDTPNQFATYSQINDALPGLTAGNWFLPPLVPALTRSLPFLSSAAAPLVERLLNEPFVVDARPTAVAMGGSPCPTSGAWSLRGTDHLVELTTGEPCPKYYEPLSDYCRWDGPLPR